MELAVSDKLVWAGLVLSFGILSMALLVLVAVTGAKHHLREILLRQDHILTHLRDVNNTIAGHAVEEEILTAEARRAATADAAPGAAAPDTTPAAAIPVASLVTAEPAAETSDPADKSRRPGMPQGFTRRQGPRFW
jgi:hypothetical protein